MTPTAPMPKKEAYLKAEFQYEFPAGEEFGSHLASCLRSAFLDNIGRMGRDKTVELVDVNAQGYPTFEAKVTQDEENVGFFDLPDVVEQCHVQVTESEDVTIALDSVKTDIRYNLEAYGQQTLF